MARSSSFMKELKVQKERGEREPLISDDEVVVGIVTPKKTGSGKSATGNTNQDSVAFKSSNQNLKTDMEEVDVRIVMVGIIGSGKSATGNTILDFEEFVSDFAFGAVTLNCEEKSGVVAGRKVSVVDTPGVFDPKLTLDETHKKLKPCIELAAPGPHVFLVAIRLGRFTKEEQNAVKVIEHSFGKKSSTYTMILFTHGDELRGKPVKELLEQDSTGLKELVDKCGGRYHVFNNETRDCTQVTELLEKIDTMVLKNGGSHYTNEMFKKAQKEKLKRDIKDVVLLHANTPQVSLGVGTAIGVAVGVGIEAGVMLGLPIGPVGSAVGGAVGGVLGLAVHTGIKVWEKCTRKE